jgi:hypothetical protein
MTFSPGLNIPTLNFGEWHANRVHGYPIPSTAGDAWKVAHDLAVVHLVEPLGKTLGFFGATVYADNWDDGRYWFNVGYPFDFQGKPAVEEGDSVEDSDTEDDGLQMETEGSITHGNSGGPFWAWFKFGGNKVGPFIVGVASGEGKESGEPADPDNFLAGGNAMLDLIAWGRANMP